MLEIGYLAEVIAHVNIEYSIGAVLRDTSSISYGGAFTGSAVSVRGESFAIGYTEGAPTLRIHSACCDVYVRSDQIQLVELLWRELLSCAGHVVEDEMNRRLRRFGMFSASWSIGSELMNSILVGQANVIGKGHVKYIADGFEARVWMDEHLNQYAVSGGYGEDTFQIMMIAQGDSVGNKYLIATALRNMHVLGSNGVEEPKDFWER